MTKQEEKDKLIDYLLHFYFLIDKESLEKENISINKAEELTQLQEYIKNTLSYLDYSDWDKDDTTLILSRKRVKAIYYKLAGFKKRKNYGRFFK